MNLTEQHEIVAWPETYHVFVEMIGPFKTNAPAAWQTAHTLLPELARSNRVSGFMSLYRMPQQIYRAGFTLEAPPTELPAELAYEVFPGGKYAKFVLTGPYSQLAEASGRVFEIVAQEKIPLRDDFNIENYVSDPRSVPENELITEILVPLR